MKKLNQRKGRGGAECAEVFFVRGEQRDEIERPRVRRAHRSEIKKETSAINANGLS